MKYFIRTCFILKKYIIFVETIKQNNMQNQITLLQENIKRLEDQISAAFTFQKGYVDNCKKAIESYKIQIEALKLNY